MSKNEVHFLEDSSHYFKVAQSALAGRIPVKYTYTGSAAFTHAALAATSAYHDVVWELDAVVKLIMLVLDVDTTIIEFGPGTGEYTLNVLNSVQASSHIHRYIGVDFSRTMLKIARRQLSVLESNTTLRFVQHDIESSEFCPSDDKIQRHGLYLVLGNLLGNVDDAVSCLNNIVQSFPVETPGIISVAMMSPDEDMDSILQPYQSTLFSTAAQEPLLCLGIDPDNLNFTLEWDNVEKAVVGYHTLLKDTFLTFHDSHFFFPADLRIQTFISRRFTIDQIRYISARAGAKIIRIQKSPTSQVLNAIIKKI